MRSQSALLTVGLPVYNGERFLQEALDSLLMQSFKNFELIISDNASTDRTQEICEYYAAKDKRIKYYRQKANWGAGKNYNYVFNLASSKYFKWATHDDVCAVDFLYKCIEVLECDRDIVLCHSLVVDIDKQGRELRRLNICRGSIPKLHNRFRNLIEPFHTCEEIFGVIRSDILARTHLIRNYTDSDRTLLGELGLYGRFYKIPEVLFFHRVHASMSTKVYNERARAAWFDPALEGRIVLSRWIQVIDYFVRIGRAPLSWRDRMACLLEIARFVKWNHGRLLQELRWGVTEAGKHRRRKISLQRE